MLAYKQLAKQLMRNKVYIIFLIILTMLTSLSFYFGMFSVDGNMKTLNSLTSLTENQQLYKNALISNTVLIYNFLISLTGLTAFVFVMFFYRFFRSNKKQIGCLKSLGFKDRFLRLFFVISTAVISAIGTVSGLTGGYFLSDILINANMKTYQVSGLVKEVSPINLAVGFGTSTFVFCATAFLCYSFVSGKETGALVYGGTNHNNFSIFLKSANKISNIIPLKNKFPYRIALRKPISLLLLFTAVMSFSVCMILGNSLNISSMKVFKSQTIGHNYEYETKFSEYQTEPLPNNVISYLDAQITLKVNDYDIEQTMIGLYNLNELYELQNINGDRLSIPLCGTVYINPGLKETYGVNIGDTLKINVLGTVQEFTVTDIAFNAKSSSIYINAGELSDIMGINGDAYNGILSIEKINKGFSTSKAQRTDDLNRNAVSNNVSGMINQLIGCIVGAILIFLALYINFQDNIHDAMILHLMGYRIKNIRKIFVGAYTPIAWTAFFLTLIPSILLAVSIQKSLSISTNDYMPFGTNIIVILTVFIILNIICLIMQVMFGFGIKCTVKKEKITEMIYSE